MKITDKHITKNNNDQLQSNQKKVQFLRQNLRDRGIETEDLIEKVASFQVAIPSWALGAGGTRFGRFPMEGEPGSLRQKIEDVGLIHALNRSSDAISLHIPWDVPNDVEAIKELANEHGLHFDAMNSNTFQDQPNQPYSYKHGSLSHVDSGVREQAIRHNKKVIEYGKALGSKALTIWLADGSNFPGQQNFRHALQRTLSSLQHIYEALPSDWKMLIEYKPYEPQFYSTVIPDWGTSHLLASKLGSRAYSLVDLGHHLPNTNIEQIVATLQMENKLGGFHFNDSKYGDDDLTAGSVKPYQLFLIFNELIEGEQDFTTLKERISWMIDASHNVKDPLEDLLQSVEAIKEALAKALVVNREQLTKARQKNDPVAAEECLKKAYSTDVRPLLAEARLRNGGAIDPIQCYRACDVRRKLINERGTKNVATGL